MPDSNPLIHSRETRLLLETHVATTALRLDQLVQTNAASIQAVKEQMTRFEQVLKYVGGLMISLILSVLAWSLTQQYSANEAQQRTNQQQIELLQERERSAQLEQQLNQSDPSGTQSTVASDGK